MKIAVLAILLSAAPWASAASAPSRDATTMTSSPADCAIFNLIGQAEIIHSPTSPGAGQGPIKVYPAASHSAVLAKVVSDLRWQNGSEAGVYSGGQRIDGLNEGELFELEQAALAATDQRYLISCQWEAPLVTLASDWDIRLRPSYPAVIPPNFDPFAACPWHQGKDSDQASPTKLTGADCTDAMSKGDPCLFFSRPLITSDGKFAVVLAGGVAGPAGGGMSVVVLRRDRDSWRQVFLLWRSPP